MMDKCEKCGEDVDVKWPSKRACLLLEALTQGAINARELYFSMPSGPVYTVPGEGGPHECAEGLS